MFVLPVLHDSCWSDGRRLHASIVALPLGTIATGMEDVGDPS